MKKIVINKGWFRSAGHQYGWQREGLDVRGVGIDKDYIRPNETLNIEIEGKEYTADCNEVIEIVKKYNSKYFMKGGTVLWIIPKDVLTLKTIVK